MEFESSKEWDSPARDIRRKWDIPIEPHMNRLHLAATLLTLTAAGNAASAKSNCENDPLLVGKCFWTHGRLSAANGNPTFRIWPIGTHRMLGVNAPSGSDQDLPPKVRRRLPADAFRARLIGDFRLCPFTRSRPERMQFVCIAGATRTVASRR
jgi:hypothetical protein